MKYRPEIDGLRAVAVIPVIFFHAGFSVMSGGYIGVDVFFVISGYLITNIIFSDMEKGSFSILNFYERRARRILPALFLIMFVSLPFAWFLLMPSDMIDFAQSLVAVSIFSSNILFWIESGYWEAASELKPLLHTWSLAVEEQYYVLFPLFLMLMWRFKKRWIFCSFILIAIMSLITAQWGAYHKPAATFYLLPMRAWEIAIGAVIALYFRYGKPQIRSQKFSGIMYELFGLTGLLLIGLSVYWFDETTPFPSLYALVPTVGAGLIILFSSQQTLVGRFLGTRLFVGIGLISYSAYLWHQPLFAFARHFSLNKPDTLTYVFLTMITFPLAFLTWLLVEKPFRNKRKFSQKSIFVFSIIGSFVFLTAGLSGYFSKGFAFRSYGEFKAEKIDERLTANQGLSPTCSEFPFSPDCRTNDEPEILVWGDSYAMHLVEGILASNPDAKVIQMTKPVCGSFFDIAPIIEPKHPASWSKECLDFNLKVKEWVNDNDNIKYVVLSTLFNSYMPGSKLLMRNGEIVTATNEIVAKELTDSLQFFLSQGINPVIFSPLPANGTDLGRCLIKAKWRGLSLSECDFSLDSLSEGRQNVYDFLEAFIEPEYKVIRLDQLLRNDFKYITHIEDVFLFRDTGHLSIEGSKTLGLKNHFYKMITEE